MRLVDAMLALTIAVAPAGDHVQGATSPAPAVKNASVTMVKPGDRSLATGHVRNRRSDLRFEVLSSSGDSVTTNVPYTREERVVSGATGREIVLTFAYGAPATTIDTLVVRQRDLEPEWETLRTPSGARHLVYGQMQVRIDAGLTDSVPITRTRSTAQHAFAFNEMEMVMRSLPLRDGYRAVVPLFSEIDEQVEIDTISVVARADARDGAKASAWTVRFADPAIVSTYEIDAATRQILSHAVTQKKSGRKMRYVPDAAAAPSDGAIGVVDTALERMGGLAALRAIRTVKYELITQWLNTSFDARAFQDGPQYELHTDMRDYDARVWRNTRRFPNGNSYPEVTDLVVDTVAARMGAPTAPGVATPAGVVDGWAPLNIAYIDERREAFAFAPERLLVLLRSAPDLRARHDTTIGGIAHAVVSATIEGYPTTAFLRRTDGFLAMARYHADESNDFGLAPWGPMEVEEWYSDWRYDATAHVSYPRQWDVRRVGQPYKRMTVEAVTFNASLPMDSLVLGESVRASYLARARRPMADLPIDSARLLGNGRIAVFHTFGAPANAVKVGTGWLLIEPGNLPLSAERAASWLSSHDPGSRVTGGIVGGAHPSGGAAWLARLTLPLYVAPSGATATSLSLHNYGAPTATSHVVQRGEWIRTNDAEPDSIWLEPLDLPNAPRSLVLYVPSMRWAYSSMIAGPLEQARVAALARKRGWRVDRIGSPRAPEGVAPN